MGSNAPSNEQSVVATTDDPVTPANTDGPALVDTIASVVAETLDDAAGSVIPVAELHAGFGLLGCCEHGAAECSFGG
jgi:hypothetical protein